MEPSVIPMCLHTNIETKSSYIGLPSKARYQNQTIFVCEKNPDTEIQTIFYVLNPDIRPIPPGTVLFCAKDSLSSDFSTISLEQIYDPFDIDQNCVRFIAWLSPVPYSTPLYIVKNGDSIFASFEKQNNQVYFSPIYVLLDPRLQGYERMKGHSKEKKNFEIVNGIPNFLFSNYQGKCVPDPSGIPFEKCLVKSILENKVQPTMLNHLKKLYGQNWDLLFILIVFVILVIGLILIFKMKK